MNYPRFSIPQTAIPDQTIILCTEAYHAFQRFLDPEFEDIRMARHPMISPNLQTLLEQIEQQIPYHERRARRKSDARLRDLNEQCRQNIEQVVDSFGNVRRGTDTENLPSLWRRLRIAALRHDFADKHLQDCSAVYSSPNIHEGIVYLSPSYETLPLNHDQPDTRAWRLNAIYDVVGENYIIREYFAKHGYEFDFDLDGHNCFVPYFHQAILSGAIGEEAITALLAAQNIVTEELPKKLFEVADMKIQGTQLYIDCKNYSDSTLEQFLLGSEDTRFYHKFSGAYFIRRAIEKWHMIADYEQLPSRLIFMNLATAHDRPLQYFCCNGDDLVPVSHYRDAQIIVMQGAVMSDRPNQYHDSFTRLLNDMENNQ